MTLNKNESCELIRKAIERSLINLISYKMIVEKSADPDSMVERKLTIVIDSFEPEDK